METKVIKITDENIIKACKEAGEIIKCGGLVAFPTETVYGLGGDGLNPESSKKIYAAKGRPSDNPLIIHIADFNDLDKIAKDIPAKACILADKYWPGPLTMRFKKKDSVPDETTGGLDTVAVRMPDNKIALEFIRAAGGFIAAPSANKSGRPSPTKAEHVYDDMNGIIPMILDGGQVGIGIESTIVDFAEGDISILRPGYITPKMIEEVIGESVSLDPSVDGVSSDAHPKAPGMKYKHYAPKAELTILEGESKEVVSYMVSLIRKDKGTKSLGLMIKKENVDTLLSNLTEEEKTKIIIKTIGSAKDPESFAHELYSVLREFDESDVERIYTESIEKKGIGVAVYNRLVRAAGHEVIKIEETE